jgi:hypothetical protein
MEDPCLGDLPHIPKGLKIVSILFVLMEVRLPDLIQEAEILTLLQIITYVGRGNHSQFHRHRKHLCAILITFKIDRLPH